MSNATLQDLARELAASIDYREARNGAAVTLPDGARVRAWLESDPDATLGDSSDYYGALKWTNGDRYGRGQRPADFDGAARKVRTRSGPGLWWQPPADIKRDPAAVARVFDRVQSYYLERWQYVGVVVEIEKAPCACAGTRAKDSASLWAVESDSGAEYFAEILGDLLAELGVGVPTSLKDRTAAAHAAIERARAAVDDVLDALADDYAQASATSRAVDFLTIAAGYLPALEGPAHA